MNVISDDEINSYKNGIVLSKEVKTSTFILIGELNNNVLIDDLIKDVKEEIKKGTDLLIHKTNVKAIHTNFKALSLNPNIHKFFCETQSSIYKIYKNNFEIKEVWGNIYTESNKDYAEEHNHGETSGFCGIIYLTDGPGPGTYFREYDLLVPEKKGRFVFFHPLLFHEVKPYKYTQERITIAFNLFELKSWDNYDHAYTVNKKIEL
jgi:hypothetical protein